MVVINIASGVPGTKGYKEEKVKMPVCWAETSTKTFQAIKAINKPDLFEGFCALIGKDFASIAKNNQEDLQVAIYQHASWIYIEEEYFRDFSMQTYFMFNGQTILIPKNIESLTVEQNMHIRNAMIEKRVLEQLISFATAVYLQPIISGDNKFNLTEALEIEKTILEMPIPITFPVGFFFLSKLNNYGATGLLYWLLVLQKKVSWMKRLLSKLMLKGSSRLQT